MSERLFIRFAIVGLVNTAIGYGVILVLHYWLGLNATAANAGGYAVGALISYALNRTFTFSSNRPHLRTLPLFAITVLGCFLFNIIILHVGLAVLGLPIALAQALAVGSYGLSFYLISRHVVFKIASSG